MKRIRYAVLLLLVILSGILFCTTLAETNPINPYYYDARIPASEIEAMPRSILSATIVCLQEPSLNDAGIWKVNVTGASGNCTYEFCVCDDQYYTPGYLNANAIIPISDDGTFSYQCVTPGEYTLLAYVTDDSGTTVSAVEYFTLEDDGEHPTIDEVVEDIARACIAAGCSTDYEKAVWLHDYLIENAEYDYTYTYYSVDGVLLRGTGVCDSYRKAYEKLLLAANVDATSVEGRNHAWNQVKLNGEWSNVDVTWDDTTQDEIYLRYQYFGLPTSLMEVNHTFETCPHECTSYDQHYYITSGFISLWTDMYSADIKSQLSNHTLYFELDAPTPYPIGDGWLASGSEHIVYGLTAHVLENTKWTAGNRTIALDVNYDQPLAKLQFEAQLDDNTLILPAGLTAIEAEAFRGGSSFMAVILPEGAQRIGRKAFSNCANLWMVVIPDSVVSIAPDAFDGCSNITIACSQGSAAQSFANQNNLNVLLQ